MKRHCSKVGLESQLNMGLSLYKSRDMERLGLPFCVLAHVAVHAYASRVFCALFELPVNLMMVAKDTNNVCCVLQAGLLWAWVSASQV